MRKEKSKHSLVIGLFIASLGFIALTLVACAHSPIPARTTLDDQSPRMVSAFFGLDNAIQQQSTGSLRFKGADGCSSEDARIHTPSLKQLRSFQRNGVTCDPG